MRSVQRHDAQQTGDETGAGESHDPAKDDPAKLAPVDGPEIVVHQSRTDGRTGQTLGGGDGQAKARGEEHGDGGAELHGETTGGGQLGDAVAKGTDDVVAVEPETSAEQDTGDNQNKDGSVGLGLDLASLEGLVGGNPGADGVGNIVGTVRDGHDHGRGNLGVGPEMLDPVVVALGLCVGAGQLVGVKGDTVAGDTLEEEPLCVVPDTVGVDVAEVGDGSEPALLGLEELLADEGVGGRVAGTIFGVGSRQVGLVVVVIARLLEVVGDLAGLVGRLVVVDDDVALGVAGVVQPGVLLPEQRAQGDVVGAEAGVAPDQTTVEVGHEEDVRDAQAAEEDGQDHAGNDAAAVDLDGVEAGDLNDDEEGEDGGGQGEVDGDHAHAPFERLLALQHRVLDGGEDDGGEGSGNGGSDAPGGSDLRDGAVLPGPLDGGACGDAHADEGTDDGLGGGHGHAHLGREEEPEGRADLGAAHGQHERGGVRAEDVDGDDAVLDGVGDAGAEGDGADEFRDHGEDADLGHGQGAGGHGRGIGVGDIVGTVTERRRAKGDCDDREDPVVLLKDGHCGW